MTNEEKLAEIKRKMKAQNSSTIVKETWGGDREKASVTQTFGPVTQATVTQVNQADQPRAPRKRAIFSDSDAVSVSTSLTTKTS